MQYLMYMGIRLKAAIFGLLLCGFAYPLLAMPAVPAWQVVTEDLPPYQTLDTQGRLTGLSTEKVRKVLQRAGLAAPIHMMPWARAYHIAQTTPNVLIYSIVRTPEREPNFHWIGRLLNTTTYVIGLSSRKDIKIQSLQDIKKYRLAVKRDDVNFEFLHRHGLDRNLVLIRNTEDTLSMLLKGRIDLTLATKETNRYLCSKIQCKTSDFSFLFEVTGVGNDYYLAASKQSSPQWLAKLTQALAEINAEERELANSAQ